MIAPSSNDETIENPPKNDSAVERLIRLNATARLLRSSDGRSYAQIHVGNRRETYALRSPAFRDWLMDTYFRTWEEVPSDSSIRRVLRFLEATARFESGTQSIFIRTGHDGNGNGSGNGSACYLDLADPSGQPSRSAPTAGRLSITRT
jgi:hypothetical protein